MMPLHAGGQLPLLQEWWDHLQLIGPDYSYHPNDLKTWLIVNDDKLEAATAAFEGTVVNITSQERRHLSAAVSVLIKTSQCSTREHLLRNMFNPTYLVD